MVVADGLDIRPLLVDRAVDEALEVGRASIGEGRAIKRELHHVGTFHEPGSARPGQQEAVRVFRMTDAHMSIGIQNSFVRQNPVCLYQVFADGV